MLRLASFLMCVLLLLAATGCAGGGAAPDSVGQERLTILTEAYPPLSFQVDDEVTGQAAETVKALMARTGTAGSIRLVPWEEGYRQVQKSPNTVLFSTVMTPERKDKLQWAGPIATLETNLYARDDADIAIHSIKDARQAESIATVADYYSEQVLETAGFDNLHSYPDKRTAIRKLLTGEADLFVGSNTAMPALLQEVDASMADVRNAFTVSTDLAYVAFSPGTSEELVDRWQQGLNAMKREGEFQDLYAEWLPGAMPPGVLQLVTEQYPPVTFMREGAPAGFVTDMVREITDRLDEAGSIRLTSWNNAYEMAKLHPNVVLFSAERTPEREDLFHWVGPVGQNKAIFYAKEGSKVDMDSLDDAREVAAIATTTGWFTEQHLQREGFTNLLSSPEPTENVRQLMNGEVELSIFTDVTVPEIVEEAGYEMGDLVPVLTVTQTEFYIAMSKGTPQARVSAWRNTLDEMKRDGTFTEIYRDYLPQADLEGSPTTFVD